MNARFEHKWWSIIDQGIGSGCMYRANLLAQKPHLVLLAALS